MNNIPSLTNPFKRNLQNPSANTRPVKKVEGIAENSLENQEQIEKFKQIRKDQFEERKREHCGNLAILPEDVRDHMIRSIPTESPEDVRKCLNIMKNFWKAPLGEEVVFSSIDVKKFANWIGEKNSALKKSSSGLQSLSSNGLQTSDLCFLISNI